MTTEAWDLSPYPTQIILWETSLWSVGSAPNSTEIIWFCSFSLFQLSSRVSLSLRISVDRVPSPACTSSAPELHIYWEPMSQLHRSELGTTWVQAYYEASGCWFPLSFPDFTLLGVERVGLIIGNSWVHNLWEIGHKPKLAKIEFRTNRYFLWKKKNIDVIMNYIYFHSSVAYFRGVENFNP